MERTSASHPLPAPWTTNHMIPTEKCQGLVVGLLHRMPKQHLFLRITTVNDTQHTQHEEGVGAFHLIDNLTDTTPHKQAQKQDVGKPALRFSSLLLFSSSICLVVASTPLLPWCSNLTNHIFICPAHAWRLAQPTTGRGGEDKEENSTFFVRLCVPAA